MFSMRMKPWPILQRSPIGPFGVVPCIHAREQPRSRAGQGEAYSHASEVPIDFLGNLMDQLAAWYWNAGLSPVQCMNLSYYG